MRAARTSALIRATRPNPSAEPGFYRQTVEARWEMCWMLIIWNKNSTVRTSGGLKPDHKMECLHGVLTPHLWLGRPSHRHGEAGTGVTVDLGDLLFDKIRIQWQLPKSMVRIRDQQSEATIIPC